MEARMLMMFTTATITMTYLFFVSQTACIEVTQQNATVEVTQDGPIKEVPLQFLVRPWPPLPVNASSTPVYSATSRVSAELYFTQVSTDTEAKDISRYVHLCTVVYDNGVYMDVENETLRCYNSSDGHIQDYNPMKAVSGHNVEFILLQPSLSDTGYYVLIIRNGSMFEVARTSRELVVYAAPHYPTIDPLPENTTIPEGSIFNLTCRVSGSSYPPPELRWLRMNLTSSTGMIQYFTEIRSIDGEERPEDYLRTNSSDGVTVRVVRLRATREDYSAVYRCESWNKVNQLNPAPNYIQQLPVVFRPSVSITPCSSAGFFDVIEGQSVTFTCNVVANPPATDIRWFQLMNGSLVEQPSRGTEFVSPVTTRSERYPPLFCSATNELGTSSNNASCSVNVLYGPNVTLPARVTVTQNQSINVTCMADSNPSNTVTFRWMKENGAFISSGPQLLITDIQPENAGIYRCVAENDLTPREGTGHRPETDFASMEVIVLHAPVLKPNTLTKFAVHADKPLTVVCEVDAPDVVTFTWPVLPPALDRQRVKITSNVSANSYRSELQIERANISTDVGTYVCAANVSGQATTFELQALKPGLPDTLQKCSTLNINITDVMFTCTRGYDGGEKISFDILNKKNADISMENTVRWLNEMDASITVTGFTENTDYSLYVFAKNSYGKSSNPFIMSDFRTNKLEILQPYYADSYTGNIGAIVGGAVGGFLCLVSLIVVSVCAYLQLEKREAATAAANHDTSLLVDDNDDEAMVAGGRAGDDEELREEVEGGRGERERLADGEIIVERENNDISAITTMTSNIPSRKTSPQQRSVKFADDVIDDIVVIEPPPQNSRRSKYTRRHDDRLEEDLGDDDIAVASAVGARYDAAARDKRLSYDASNKDSNSKKQRYTQLDGKIYNNGAKDFSGENIFAESNDAARVVTRRNWVKFSDNDMTVESNIDEMLGGKCLIELNTLSGSEAVGWDGPDVGGASIGRGAMTRRDGRRGVQGGLIQGMGGEKILGAEAGEKGKRKTVEVCAEKVGNGRNGSSSGQQHALGIIELHMPPPTADISLDTSDPLA